MALVPPNNQPRLHTSKYMLGSMGEECVEQSTLYCWCKPLNTLYVRLLSPSPEEGLLLALKRILMGDEFKRIVELQQRANRQGNRFAVHSRRSVRGRDKHYCCRTLADERTAVPSRLFFARDSLTTRLSSLTVTPCQHESSAFVSHPCFLCHASPPVERNRAARASRSVVTPILRS